MHISSHIHVCMYIILSNEGVKMRKHYERKAKLDNVIGNHLKIAPPGTGDGGEDFIGGGGYSTSVPQRRRYIYAYIYLYICMYI